MSDSTPWAELIAGAEATLTSTEMPDGSTPSDAQDLFIAVSRSTADGWNARSDEVLRAAGAGREDFTRALREQWGPSLDALELFFEGAEQFGADFVTSQPRDNQTVLTEIVLTLHAAACVCAHEIHWLLSGGYPTGAESRSRTLHEVAVTALLLADHGAEDDDLVQRYLDHRVVSEWRYWNYIAQHHADVGTEAPDAAFIARLQSEVDDLTARYSKAFKNDYGWAIPLVVEGKLEEVEKLVGRGDRRPLYKGRQLAGGPRELGFARSSLRGAIRWSRAPEQCDHERTRSAGRRRRSLPVGHLQRSHRGGEATGQLRHAHRADDASAAPG